MRLFAIGRPGQPVERYSTNPASAFLLEGQVMVEQGDEPTSPMAINSDGTALVAIEEDAEAIVARAWDAVRWQRNLTLDAWRWAVQPDSPLTDDSRAEVLAFLRTLNRLTVDYATPDAVKWPEPPTPRYQTAG